MTKIITRIMNATSAASPGLCTAAVLSFLATSVTNPNLALLAVAGVIVSSVAAIGCGFMGFLEDNAF